MTPWRGDGEGNRQHRLVFELVPTVLLAAGTGEWLLVGVLGAVLLPAARAMWVGWVMAGFGPATFVISVVLAATWTWQAALACLIVSAAFGLWRGSDRLASVAQQP